VQEWSDEVTEMDRGVRIALAFCVLSGGTVVALLFRHHLPETGHPPADTSAQLVLRRRVGPQIAESAVSGRPGEGPGSVAAVPDLFRPAATVLKPLDPGDPPPALARSYHHTALADTSRWGTSIGLGLPDSSESPDRHLRHKIVDGDTLDSLAEKYLGSANRGTEIYELNRDLLSTPDVLPIGVELKIPGRHPPPSASEEIMPERPLVPVHGDSDPAGMP